MVVSTVMPNRLDRLAAAPMFLLSAAALFLLALMLHLHGEGGLHPAGTLAVWALAALVPVFAAEVLAHWACGSPQWKRGLWCCAFPPLRLSARDRATGRHVWLPLRGWALVDDSLRGELEKAFSLPMIAIALLVLPLMAFEHFAAERIAQSESLVAAVETATALIWFAFTFEFLLMISIVDHKLQYAKEHWIDVLVIVLPLVAFLRAARLGRVLRLQQLSRTVRMYRLRGLLMRAYRAVLLLEVIDRLLRRDPRQKLARLQRMVLLKEAELRQLREATSALEARLAEVDPPSAHAA